MKNDMNERIQELSEQAVYYDEDEESWEFDRKKFAELIVRECLFIIDDEREPNMVDRVELWKQILEHFGVEE